MLSWSSKIWIPRNKPERVKYRQEWEWIYSPVDWWLWRIALLSLHSAITCKALFSSAYPFALSAEQEIPLTPNDLLKKATFPPDTPDLNENPIKESAQRLQPFNRIAKMLKNCGFWSTCSRWHGERRIAAEGSRLVKETSSAFVTQLYHVEIGRKAPLLEWMVTSDGTVIEPCMGIGPDG